MNPDLQNQKPQSRLRGAPSGKPIPGPDGKPMTAEQLFSANLLALTEIEADLKDSLADIAESLEVISLYFERRGRKDGLFTDKDFAPGDAPEAGEVSDEGSGPTSEN